MDQYIIETKSGSFYKCFDKGKNNWTIIFEGTECSLLIAKNETVRNLINCKAIFQINQTQNGQTSLVQAVYMRVAP